jgi:hypothetical protein
MPRGEYDARNEIPGPTYELRLSEQRQTGDPTPHGIPSDYAHPQALGRDVLDPGGPRILPVSQKITHGPEQSREEAFDREAREAAAGMVEFFNWLGFRDRRAFGRRYRATDNIEDLDGAQQPPQRGGWQRDVPFERYMRSI